jgi:N-methylhydantoinase A
VSAGGGSIAWVDRAGSLRVGPRSAGAEPGPVCYGRGGTEPTVTDCNLLLGYLDKGSLLAGDLPIDLAAAEAAINARLAKPLGVDARTAAAGVIDIVNHAMGEALKIVSVQRGHDPRAFVLAAFGGAGPLHAAALADELGIAQVICPPIPGAFSALGLVGSDLRRDYVRTVYATTATADPDALQRVFAGLEAEGSGMLDRAGVTVQRRRFERSIDARYERQSYELAVPVTSRTLDADALRDIAGAFHERHRRTYGHDNRDEPVQLVSARVTAVGAIPALTIATAPAASGTQAVKGQRAIWFRSGGATDASVYDRRRMPSGCQAVGPAVIESLESTILVPPGWLARMDDAGFVHLTRSQSGDNSANRGGDK